MKNYMPKVLTALAVAMVSILVSGVNTSVYAKTECVKQYGGGETCITVEEGDLDVDKTIWNPASDHYQDHISPNSGSNPYRFKDDQKIYFRIKVENTGETDLEDIDLVDILPPYVEYNSGDGDEEDNGKKVEFDKFDLDSGESETFEFTAKVDFNGIRPKDDYVCITNIATAESEDEESSDFANFCIEVREGEVLGKEVIRVLPKTGGEQLLVVPLSLGLMLVGYGLKKFVS